ncbi:hypothetical protein [Mycobacteroides abscessus]|uniref:hypothetical protein n=1 Tax=Mycobacteroides abscessus TaxID=36809 RepID=UPI0010C99182|nr:hypothetical protein [Mycobacteroides abscessus]TKV35391.1 hypothetical protein CFA71_24320 [Mycobacteroides abscessus subsp. bolletii]
MAKHDEHDSSNRGISTAHAMKYLGITPRTAIKRIKNDTLPGYVEHSSTGGRDYYYFYPPEPEQSPSPAPSSQPSEIGTPSLDPVLASALDRIAQLEAEKSDLHAELVAERETVRLLRLARESNDAALADYRAAFDDIDEGFTKYRRGAQKFRSSAEKFSLAYDLQDEAIGQLTTPGHLGSLDQ